MMGRGRGGTGMAIGMSALVAAFWCVVLAGCAKATGPTQSTEPESFADVVAAAIQEAEAGGAGDAQLAILRKAQSEGELSLEDARVAARAAVECMTDAGILVGYSEHTRRSGLVVPEYSAEWIMGDDEHNAVIDACDQREDLWVNMVYQTQPTSLAMNEEYNDQQAPLVRSCLERNGYATDPDASPLDLMRQAIQVEVDTDSAVDCLTEAEIE